MFVYLHSDILCRIEKLDLQHLEPDSGISNLVYFFVEQRKPCQFFRSHSAVVFVIGPVCQIGK